MVRRKRRSRRRNAWFNHKAAHRRAALKGLRRRGMKGRRKRSCARGRYARGRYYNPGYAYHNRRRRNVMGPHRLNRRYRRRNGRRRYRNPELSLKRPVGALTAAFNLGTLQTAGTLVAGAVGTGVVGGLLNTEVLGRLAPSVAGTFAARTLVNLGAAGIVGALGGFVNSRVGADMLTGGVVKAVVDVVNNFMPSGIGGARPFAGMRDFLIEQQVGDARPLAGLNDFLIEQQVGDARPLAGIGMGGALEGV